MFAAIKRASQNNQGFGNFSIALKKSIIAFTGKVSPYAHGRQTRNMEISIGDNLAYGAKSFKQSGTCHGVAGREALA